MSLLFFRAEIVDKKNRKKKLCLEDRTQSERRNTQVFAKTISLGPGSSQTKPSPNVGFGCSKNSTQTMVEFSVGPHIPFRVLVRPLSSIFHSLALILPFLYSPDLSFVCFSHIYSLDWRTSESDTGRDG